MMLTLYFHKHTSSAGCHGTGYAFAVSNLPFLGKRSHSCSSAAGRATPHHEWMGRYHRKRWPGKKSVEVSTEGVCSLRSKGKQGPKLITIRANHTLCKQGMQTVRHSLQWNYHLTRLVYQVLQNVAKLKLL